MKLSFSVMIIIVCMRDNNFLLFSACYDEIFIYLFLFSMQLPFVIFPLSLGVWVGHLCPENSYNFPSPCRFRVKTKQTSIVNYQLCENPEGKGGPFPKQLA